MKTDKELLDEIKAREELEAQLPHIQLLPILRKEAMTTNPPTGRAAPAKTT